jgi:hypothetical protein
MTSNTIESFFGWVVRKKANKGIKISVLGLRGGGSIWTWTLL